MNIITKRAAALGVASALAFAAAVPAWAGPIPTGTAAVKAAASDQLTDVRWRGRGGRGIGPGLAFGLAAGALVGAAVAAQPYGYGPGYDPGYYYGEPGPVYAQPYGYQPVYPAPGYYAPGYQYGQCYTDEGNGRRRPC